MTVAKRESRSEPPVCPGCRKGEKTIEASRERYEHFLSIARSRGPERLKEHLIEQFGEETFNSTYGGMIELARRKLLVEGWREDMKGDV